MAEKLFCTSCNYTFKPRVSGKAPSRCPYCDKERTLEPVKSMQEWIDEVETELP
jgi:predicted Zn-ribbon and HTH transcriptional regulator